MYTVVLDALLQVLRDPHVQVQIRRVHGDSLAVTAAFHKEGERSVISGHRVAIATLQQGVEPDTLLASAITFAGQRLAGERLDSPKKRRKRRRAAVIRSQS